jgi:hypothetical protein
MKELDVRTLLADLADTPPPPSRVDVEGAMTTARRRARAKTWTSVAASILVVGAAAGVTYTVIERPPPATTVTTVPTVAQAPGRFDPLTRYASFGWLPEEPQLTWQNTLITTDRFDLSATEHAPGFLDQPTPLVSVNVRLYAAGVVPQTEQPLEAWSPEGKRTVEYGPVTEAPAVNGARAYWVGVPEEPAKVILKWRYTPDGWAELSADGLTGDVRATMHRIAGAVHLGGMERIRFPFHLTGLSPALRPTSSQSTQNGPDEPWSTILDLNTQADGKGPGLSVAVRPTNLADAHTPNTTVDGRPARREQVDGDHLGVPQYSDRLFVNDVDGLQASIFIDAKTPAAAAPLASDGVLSVYKALTLHPDRADWTDRPLR